MSAICGANCAACGYAERCGGCEKTCGRPFGGRCVAAEYICLAGREAYAHFRTELLAEINTLLTQLELPTANGLFELVGEAVNLEYPIPSGSRVKLLDDRRIYLGCQLSLPGAGVCWGVVADTDFILVCSYSVDGSEPELLCYRKR